MKTEFNRYIQHCASQDLAIRAFAFAISILAVCTAPDMIYGTIATIAAISFGVLSIRAMFVQDDIANNKLDDVQVIIAVNGGHLHFYNSPSLHTIVKMYAELEEDEFNAVLASAVEDVDNKVCKTFQDALLRNYDLWVAANTLPEDYTSHGQ